MRITKHAMERIKERNVTQAELVATIRDGKYMVNKWDANKLTVVNNEVNLYVVMSKSKDTIITVFRKEK